LAVQQPATTSPSIVCNNDGSVWLLGTPGRPTNSLPPYTIQIQVAMPYDGPLGNFNGEYATPPPSKNDLSFHHGFGRNQQERNGAPAPKRLNFANLPHSVSAG
jgi:hypothetical protein